MVSASPGTAETDRRRFRRKEEDPMNKSMLFALSLIAVSGSAAMAQSTPFTSQEQAACRPDAIKLCASNVGQPAAMKACLEQNKASLSDACRQVVEAHGG
jgi:hypothetical protein